ncbi:MAG: hypothetical protein H0V82_03540 [Candidatus Protochlamydia sp.]|nr:hypothetical protein [Candidatus Protochlamydia sp.]
MIPIDHNSNSSFDCTIDKGKNSFCESSIKKKNLKRTFTSLNPFDANALSNLPPDLEKLVIRGYAWELNSDEALQSFTSPIKRLKKLHVEGTTMDLPTKSLNPILKANQQIIELLANNSNIDGASLKMIPNNILETITLSYCELLSCSELIEFLKNNPQIKNLQLSHTLVTKDVAVAIATYSSQLEILELSNSKQIEEDDFIKIAHHCSKLREIYVSCAAAFSDRVLIEFLQSCPGLNKIEATSTDIGDPSLRKILDLKRPIKMLRINRCNISCDGLEGVLKVSRDTLEILDFSSPNVDKRIIKLLETYRPPLINLNLSGMHDHFFTAKPKVSVLLNTIKILSEPICRIKDVTTWNFEDFNRDTLEELMKICPTIERIYLSTGQLMDLAGSYEGINVFCEKFEKEFKIELSNYPLSNLPPLIKTEK